MKPSPRQRAIQQAMRAKRDALKRKLARAKPARDRRRWWLLVLLVVLLLWALLPDCAHEEPPPALALGIPVSVPAQSEPIAEPPEPPKRVGRRDRPAFDSETPDLLPWIVSLRMQVAARSPRLAQCFIGVERPGRLKWTASVEPQGGLVSDHSLEPTLQSDELTEQQRICVIGVLSEPPYRLPSDERSTPSRVSMVIEF